MSEKQEKLDLYWPFIWPLQFYLFWWIVGFDMLFGTENASIKCNENDRML